MRLIPILLSLLGIVHSSVLRPKRPESDPHCTNTAPHNGVDRGCNTTTPLPICFLSSGYEPGADSAGNKCGKCINTVNSDLFPDLGCPPATPLCDAPLGQGGTTCLLVSFVPPTCTNTATYGGVDARCSRDTPLCTNSRTGRQVGAHAPGDVCATCVKVFAQAHYRYGLTDYGCSSQLPRCMTSKGTDPATLKAGGKCCTAEGVCETGSACPCNRLGSIWNDTVAGINRWDSSDLMCMSSPSLPFASLYVTGTPAGMGAGRVVIADNVSVWVCSDQVKDARTISEAEGRACYEEVLVASKALGVSDCLLY